LEDSVFDVNPTDMRRLRRMYLWEANEADTLRDLLRRAITLLWQQSRTIDGLRKQIEGLRGDRES
jgi:hypothetical protein